MSFGYIVSGKCFPDINAAVAMIQGERHVFTHTASFSPLILNHVQTITASAGVSNGIPDFYMLTYQYRNSAQANTLSLQSQIKQADCSAFDSSGTGSGDSGSGFWDGYIGDDFIVVGWQIVGLWVVAYCFGQLVRFINEYR